LSPDFREVGSFYFVEPVRLHSSSGWFTLTASNRSTHYQCGQVAFRSR
jgi:hypothetical protein